MLVLEDQYASRRHAEIAWDGSSYVLTDLGSRNGTTLNGSPVREPARLRHGDVLGIGETLLVFQETDETLLREAARAGEGASAGPERLRLDPAVGDAWLGTRRLDLTVKEFLALSLLYREAGAVCRKEDLAAQVWPEYQGDVGDNNIEQLMYRLRRKVEDDPQRPRHLLTVRGRGYRWLQD